MGPTPGRYGCKAVVRGDTANKPRGPERRKVVVEWLGRRGGHDVQDRLAAAQLRKESQAQEAPDKRKPIGDDHEEETIKRHKGARSEDLNDDWVVNGNKVIWHRCRPILAMFTPVNTGCLVDPSKLSSTRLTHAINDATGDSRTWRQLARS